MLFRKLKKRRVQLVQRPLVAPTAQNEWWAMDFVHDAFVDGRKFRCLVVEDVYSRKALALEVDRSFGGQQVVGALERLAVSRGLPQVITVDNGPEFLSRALAGGHQFVGRSSTSSSLENRCRTSLLSHSMEGSGRSA